MSSWPEAHIGEHCDVKGGKRLPKGEALQSLPTSHPYIRVVDMQDGRIERTSLQYVPDDVYPRIERYTVSSGNIMISIVGTIGSVAIIPPELNGANLTENAAKIVPTSDDVDGRFLYYFLRSREGQATIRAQTVGSTQPKLALYRIKDISFVKPPLSTQRRIAHILGTLDDKIELNRRMNRTLEAIARAIFKSWFVDFDPVHAKAEGREPVGMDPETAALFPDSFQDSPLGKIPKGWEVGTLGGLCEKPQYGYTESAKEEPVGPRFLRIKDINKQPWIEWETVPYCEIDQARYEKYKLASGDIVVARIADPGHAAYVEENVKAVFASYLIRFRPTDTRYGRYIQYWQQSLAYWDLVRGRRSGSTRGNLNAKVLRGFPLLIPPVQVAERFAESVGPLRVLVQRNLDESFVLAQTRDTLLPALLGGQFLARLERQKRRCDE